MFGRTDAQTRGRTALSRAMAVAVPLCVCASVRPAFGQCPDGTPPPCARAIRTATPARNSVAVLYLENQTRDSAYAFLADGLTEEIIIRLSQVPRLAVKSRFEVDRIRGRTGLDPQTLGRMLDAAYLVTGSVQAAGGRVRLRVELVRAATRTQVWGDVFDEASGDILNLESDVARRVATSITGQLLPEERQRLSRPVTSDPVAYEWYLRGLQAAHNFGDEAALRSAIAFFDRAIGRDSSMAAAFAGKAVAWSMLADGYVSPREGYGETRLAAAQALARDSGQVLAWAMLANTSLALDLDAHAAERYARRGVALDAHAGWPRVFLSMALLAQDRDAEAVDAARRAWQDDSLFSLIGLWNIAALCYVHRADSALAWIPRLRAFAEPSDVDPTEGFALATLGRFREAEPLLSWRYYGGFVAGMYVKALLARGDTAAARATVDSMLAARTPGYYNPVALAEAYTALGDLDHGSEWLQRAIDERTLFLAYVRHDVVLAPLRADPRYAALDRQLRF